MFRVYTCSSCGNISYTRVEQENDCAYCGLCGGLVIHERGMLYAATVNEAREYVTDLINEQHIQRTTTTRSRGRGIRRRVIDIIQSLVEVNRGRPVSLDTVLVECSDAGIDVERARHFLDVLISEGVLNDSDAGLSMGEEW
jgi:hypothetical protein